MVVMQIVLVAYHSDPWIEPCLDSLREACRGDWRVILVDNGGNTRLAPYAAWPNVTLLQTPRSLGFAEANNFALVQGDIRGEAVCFLNQDTVSGPGWLDACVALMKRQPDIGAVMPLITDYGGTAWDEAFRTCARASRELSARLEQGVTAELSDLPPFVPVPEITAAAMVVRTAALAQAGPFDPIYGSYYEDYDLCRRIAAAGYAVGICTRGRIGHYGGSVTTDRAAYLRRARWITRNRVIYAARWQWKNRPWGLLRYLLMTMPRNGLRSLLGRSQIPFRAFLAGHGDLAKVGHRLCSATADRAAWQRYLQRLEWDKVVRGNNESPCCAATVES